MFDLLCSLLREVVLSYMDRAARDHRLPLVGRALLNLRTRQDRRTHVHGPPG